MNYAYYSGVLTAKIKFLAADLARKGLINHSDYDEVRAMCEKIVEESENDAKDYAECNPA